VEKMCKNNFDEFYKHECGKLFIPTSLKLN